MNTPMPLPDVFDAIPPSGLTMREALALMDNLRAGARSRYDWDAIRSRFSKLLGRQILSFIDTPSQPMIRGRAFPMLEPGKGRLNPPPPFVKNVSELGPREDSKVTNYGRCHVPKSAVFYAAFNEETVLTELQPELKSLVYLLKCKPKPGAQFHSVIVGEMDYIRRFGRGTIFSKDSPLAITVRNWLANVKTETDYVRLVTDAFLGELMSSRAYTLDDYKVTSALCGLLLELNVESCGSAEAIYYPSVAHRGGVNIALTSKAFREKVQVESCKIVQVHNNFGLGIYQTHVVSESSSIDDQGTITWQSSPTSAEIFKNLVQL